MKHLLALSVVLAALIGVTAQAASPGPPLAPEMNVAVSDAALRLVSNLGSAVTPRRGQLSPLRTFKGRDLRVLGHRDGIWVYAFRNRAGPLNCFGDGTATTFGTSGAFGCPPSFPTSQSVYDLSAHLPCSTAYAVIAGVASDGVATVSALDPSGHVAAKTKVVGNIYVIDGTALASRLVVTLIARDLTGKIVFRSPTPSTEQCSPGGGPGE